MINELTPEQVAKIPEYVDKWVSIGLDTGLANREVSESLLDEIYKVGGFNPPTKIWADSPFHIIKILKEMGEVPNSSNFCYGNNDAGWLGYCDYIKNELKLDCIDPLIPTIELSKHVGWYYPMDDTCILCEKPEFVSMKDKKLHNDNGPSIRFRDGIEFYHLNGVLVTKEIVMTPWDEIDPQTVLTEKNAEVRREIIRKIGVERFVEKIGAEVIDKQGDYELLLVDIGDGNKRPYLKMINPSIGTYHIEGVAPDIKTVFQALKWRNGTDEKPSVLT